MTRRPALALLLLLALAASTSGLGRACPGLEGSADTAAFEAAAARAEEALPPCHRKASAGSQGAHDSGADETGSARTAPSAPHPGKEGGGCCDPASGMTCPHACHFLAVPRDEAALSLGAVLAPLAERPAAAAPAPLPRGVDHIPLA